MTKTSIIAIALFSSACATNADDFADDFADAEADLEEIIRSLDDDESSSEKDASNVLSLTPTDTATKTIFEKAEAEFKAELQDCNPLRAVAGKYSPDSQKFYGFALDDTDMPTGEMAGSYSWIDDDQGLVKGSIKDYGVFGGKVSFDGDIIGDDIEVDVDADMTMFIRLAPWNNGLEGSAPMLGMLAICG